MQVIGMSYDGLSVAIKEAERFITAARRAQRRSVRDKRNKSWTYGPTKENGQARRTSLDLTRTLADLRRYS